MKIKSNYIVILFFCTAILSCKKDNYEPPTSLLTGRLVYNKGEAIGVEYGQVPYELYQYGFGKVGPIGSTFAPDGTYSQLLFDGEYKFIIPNGQGPFMWKKTASGAPDSLTITMNGNQTLDIEVTPYYLIGGAQFTASGGKVSGSCKIEKIITDPANAKDLEKVTLYINKTQFVSGANNIASSSLNGSAITDPNNIQLSVSVPNIVPAQNYVFARIGIKIAGVEDMLFSPVQKVQL